MSFCILIQGQTTDVPEDSLNPNDYGIPFEEQEEQVYGQNLSLFC